MLIIRRIGLIVIAVLAVAAVFVLAPSKTAITAPTDHASDRSSIESEYSSSEASTTTVFQQIASIDVATKSVDELISKQLDEQAAEDAVLARESSTSSRDDRRVPAEGALGVCAVALWGVTSGRRRGRELRPASGAVETQQLDAAETTVAVPAVEAVSQAAGRRNFDAVWKRIEEHAGEDFRTVRGVQFTYEVEGNAVRPPTNRLLSRTNFERALAQLPTDGPGGLAERQGPSYTWAILMDPRVRGDDWA